jgi:hypothetical protein
METSSHTEPPCPPAPSHLWKAVEGLTQVGAVTEEMTTEVETQNLLKDVVSRLGLEPRALALKGRKDENIIGLILRRFPRSIFASNDLSGFY